MANGNHIFLPQVLINRFINHIYLSCNHICLGKHGVHWEINTVVVLRFRGEIKMDSTILVLFLFHIIIRFVQERLLIQLNVKSGYCTCSCFVFPNAAELTSCRCLASADCVHWSWFPVQVLQRYSRRICRWFIVKNRVRFLTFGDWESSAASWFPGPLLGEATGDVRLGEAIRDGIPWLPNSRGEFPCACPGEAAIDCSAPWGCRSLSPSGVYFGALFCICGSVSRAFCGYVSQAMSFFHLIFV